MNVIFLDIEGVLMPKGSHEYLRMDAQAYKDIYVAMDERYQNANAYDIAAVGVDWYPRAVANIQTLVKTCNAHIILTSTWRIQRSLEVLKLLFSHYDLGDALMDVTVDYRDKIAEIRSYLRKYPEIKSYVVIDDMDMENAFHHHFVHVIEHYFNEENLKEAIQILSGN